MKNHRDQSCSLRPGAPRRGAAFVLCFLLTTSTFSADDLVARRTDSADFDLISELLSRGLIETASKICDRHLLLSQADSDEQARWLIESSRTKIAAMLQSSPDAAQGDRQQATAAIDKLLTEQPGHQRALWLQFQRELVDLAASRRAVMVAIVKPPDDPFRDGVLKQTVRVAVKLRELSKAIETEIMLERNRSIDSSRVAELIALAVTVASKRIEAVLLRGELFVDGSPDFIASANESLTAANDLVISLPAGTDGRDELLLQLAESQRRTGELEQAASTIAPLLAANTKDAALLAIAARIAMDQRDFDKASDWLSPTTGQNLDLDLARLQLAILKSTQSSSSQSQSEIGVWIERIGKQHGDYARRRAERLVLGTSVSIPQMQLDPRIIIAQAASRIRAGNPQQAGEWLAAAARSNRDPAAAIQLAIAGAAALRQANDISAAAGLLRETSLAHFKHPDAAKLHLQAAVLLADKVLAESFVEHLQEGITTWPADTTSMTATDWLIRLHQARGEALAAARAASNGDPAWMTPERISGAGRLWIEALLSLPFAEREPVASEATALLRRDGFGDKSKSATAPIAALFGERSELNAFKPEAIETAWLRWLLEIRQGGAGTDIPAHEADRSWLLAASDRLIADGKRSPNERRTLAHAVLSLVGSIPSFQASQAYGWTGDWQRSVAMLAELRQQQPNDLKLAQECAQWLSAAEDQTAKRAGLKLWQELSAQLPQGTNQWHETKLATIELLRSLGEHAESQRIANYVMLTQPPTNPVLAARYVAAAK